MKVFRHPDRDDPKFKEICLKHLARYWEGFKEISEIYDQELKGTCGNRREGLKVVAKFNQRRSKLFDKINHEGWKEIAQHFPLSPAVLKEYGDFRVVKEYFT
jgi:hypothetical protein